MVTIPYFESGLGYPQSIDTNSNYFIINRIPYKDEKRRGKLQ